MTSRDQDSLAARKTPVQTRSQATVQAISEATIQVLLRDRVEHLTTTRVAQRAGVSVGTLYQYYRNKEALLHTVPPPSWTRTPGPVAPHSNEPYAVEVLPASRSYAA